ncbi:MAG: alkyl sulfatase dimerization domain-containing protein [Acidimicrobiales bacterium]|nr:alkyl sulfatase dimerization domain-containing protein [Acidimicrobiales bacterium]
MRDPLYKSRPVDPYSAMPGQAERLHDIVVMSEGLSNVYLLETDGPSVLVNTGSMFEAPVHRDNLAAYSNAPISHVALTQGHVDHVGGIRLFRELHPGLEVIAQAGNPEHQALDALLSEYRRNRSHFAFGQELKSTFFAYRDAGYDFEFDPTAQPQADVLFEDRHSFEVGGLQIELIACPGAETNDSLVVWLPQHRIVATGNLFGCTFGHFPNLCTMRGDRYRDALVVADAVQTVLDLDAEMILYGHHQPIVGADLIKSELSALRDAIHFVHDETVRGMNERKDVRTLMREITLPPEIEVGEGYGTVRWGVRSIWENYSGWFHQQSTTELYDIGPEAIGADLVELAGADQLVSRAVEHIAAGRALEATHLLDIVLGDQPNHEAARATSIDAHQRLLDESDNLWTTRWCQFQIKQLTK